MKTVFSKDNGHIALIGKVSDDKMKYFVDGSRLTPGPVTRDEIIALLREAIDPERLNLGVIDDIAKMLSNGEVVTERRVAKGKEPVPGADGKVLFLVKRFTGEADLRPDAQGRVDYFDLNLFENIASNQAVARVYPPKPGEDGHDAFGSRLAAKPGKPFKVSIDKSLTIEASTGETTYDSIVSLVEGYLVEESGRLSVKEELVLPRDLDFHFGNISFVGRVVVQGSVMPGFSVRGKKGIEIRGNFEAGRALVAEEGDIIVKGYASGGAHTSVTAGGTLRVTAARDLDAEAVGDIVIEKEASGCRFRTESSIVGERGHLFGGESFAVCGVDVRVLGTDAGLRTVLHLCSDVETRGEYRKIVQDLSAHDQALRLLELHLGPLVRNAARVQLLAAGHREKMEALLKKYHQVDASRISLLARQEAMLKEGRGNDVYRVNARQILHSGVEVRAGGEVFEVKDDITGPISLEYRTGEKAFAVGPMVAISCDVAKGAPKSEERVEKSKRRG